MTEREYRGYTPAEATESMRKIMDRLAKSQHDLADALKRYGVDVRDASDKLRDFTDVVHELQEKMEAEKWTVYKQ